MEILVNSIIKAAGWSIIHSLWQGALIYSVLLLLFVMKPKLTSKLRHDLSFMALIGIFLWFAFTFYKEFSSQEIPENSTITGSYASASPKTPGILSLPSSIFNTVNENIPFIVWMYVTGLILQTVYLLFGYYRVLQIKTQGLTDIPKDLNDHFSSLIMKFGIKRKIQFSYSSRVSVPMLIGYFKPVILLPLSILSHLHPEQLEAVIIHELSHIRRNDYLLNLLKITIETILFFNPFVWLSAKLVDAERENVCDDLVLKITGSPLLYAQTLLQLENIKQDQQVFSMAITGKKYYLLNRIKRITTMKSNNTSLRQQLFAIMLIAATVFALSCSENKSPEKLSSRPQKLNKQEQKTVITDTTAGTMKIRNKADVLELLKKLNIKPNKNGKISFRAETGKMIITDKETGKVMTTDKLIIAGKEIDIRNLSKETIELLKKLDIRTDKNGKVTLHGQPVKKLVVNGKEIIAKNSADDQVEELLKKLPGIEVNKDGKITAQGQVVNKIVVDGKEIDKTELLRMQEKLKENMEKAREHMLQQTPQPDQNGGQQMQERLKENMEMTNEQMVQQTENAQKQQIAEIAMIARRQQALSTGRNLERVQELYKQLQFAQKRQELLDAVKNLTDEQQPINKSPEERIRDAGELQKRQEETKTLSEKLQEELKGLEKQIEERNIEEKNRVLKQ